MRYLPHEPYIVVILIWICFLGRGLFYCSFLPLWEGYDEWAHFAYIERLATDRQFLVDRNEPVSGEVNLSLRLVPIPWELRGMPNPSVTEDSYWRLQPEERAERQWNLNTMRQILSDQKDSAGPRIYEALQPPLYYWLLSVPYRLARNTSMVNRVFLLRYLSLFIAGFSIPLVFLVARRVVGNPLIAVGASALVAVMPGLMVDVCRVGNECVGILLFSWLTLLSLDVANEVTPRTTAVWAGVTLGLGLLTKAYFLTAIPALAIVYLWRFWQTEGKRALLCHSMLTFGSASLIAGWWYVHNRVTTGAWSGLSESVILLNYSPRLYLTGIKQVPWGRAIDAILLSHIWFGGWSSLGLRSWMYHVFFVITAIASFGIVSVLWRSKWLPRRSLYPLLSVYGLFWVGQLYNVLLLFLSKGAPTSMGWYMYCVVAAEAILLLVGLIAIVPGGRRLWAIPALILCVSAVDLYSVHFVSIPYYVGLIAHRQNGSLESLHLARLREIGLSEVFNRLSVNKASWLTPFALEIGWFGYFSATAALIALSLWVWWKSRSRA